MLVLAAMSSKEQVWDILFGLGALVILLHVLGLLLATLLLLREAWRGWKQRHSPNRQQRQLGLAKLAVVAGVLLYVAGRLLWQQREQEQFAIEHQAVEVGLQREAAREYAKATRKKEQQDSLYFKRLEAGQVDTSLFRPAPQAEAQWQ